MRDKDGPDGKGSHEVGNTWELSQCFWRQSQSISGGLDGEWEDEREIIMAPHVWIKQ